MLDVLESMEKELTQKDSIIRQKDSEIRTLQGQLNESLNLCEKLNSENKAENVQALKNELKQTKELLQNEKEKKKRADSTIEECQDKLRQAELEKEYVLTHQKKVEIPVEKPVLYERCRNCDRRACQQAKERYEHQRNGICQSGKWIVDIGNALAQVGDRITNEMMAIVAHWLLFIIVIVGAAVAVGVLMVIGEKKVTKVYRENCWDMISVGVAVTSVALVVYFGDWIKGFVKLNLVVLLLLIRAVYVGIRVYVNGCRRARGYY